MNRITVLVDDKMLLVLKSMAKEHSTTVSQMIRRLVLEESKRTKES